MEELDCSACSCLTELQNLPKSLKELNCHGCTYLVSLDGVPPTIEKITVNHGIKHIPDYIPNYKISNLSDNEIEKRKEAWTELQKQKETSSTIVKTVMNKGFDKK